MSAETLVVDEVRRQFLQGFFEKKSIFPFGGSFNFSIYDGFAGLQVNFPGVRYREDVPDFHASQDGNNLLELEDDIYEPFASLMVPVTGLMGPGKANVPVFYSQPGDRWRWKEEFADDLETGIKQYRFGKFSYKSEDGNSVQFLPDRNPGEPVGEYKFSFPFSSPDDISLNQLVEIMRVMDE